MLRFILCFMLLVFVVSKESRAEGDAVREAIEKAKTEYQASLTKYRELAKVYFDKREEEARKQGNKRSVDELKVAREAFDQSGILPPSAPAVLRVRPANALSGLKSAYSKAVKEYTRTKHDDLAAAAEKELEVFQAEAGYPPIAGVWREGPDANGIRVAVTQNGDKFIAACSYRRSDKVEIAWRMTGTITKGGEVNGTLIHTKAPQGYQNQTRTGKLSDSNDTIEGKAMWPGGQHDFQWTLVEN
ncbi:hypothetical protein NA78x_003786 [Anatilimnocola sp. NA78]|uniref:hypothetical protein n=1 Tax=Anatilimnocola sp. NA78 TaxID=3415683 RepID=UPI003CE53229